MEADHQVAIVGGGFSGIGAAIKLDDAGFGDLVDDYRFGGARGAPQPAPS